MIGGGSTQEQLPADSTAQRTPLSLNLSGGGQIIEANGVSVGQSDRFYKGELKDISRTLLARRESGVAIWQKKK